MTVSRDVTVQKQVEEELRESRERLSLVVEGAKAGVWDWDMQTNRVLHDKQWKAILGFEEHEISGDTDMWVSRWHPDDADHIKAAMEDYLQGKTEKYEVKYRLQHKDGTYRWILTNGKVTRDQDGKPVRWTGFNIDINDQRLAEELYLESEKRLREFAEAVPDASFIIDEDGQYLEVFGDQTLLPATKEQVKDCSVYQVLQQDDADFLLNEVRQAIASGVRRSGFREMQIGGHKRYHLRRVVPLSYMVDGKRTVAIITTDITERYKNEKMLQMTYELRRRSDFINDILNGRTDKDEDLAYLSSKLGLDMSLPVFVCKLLSNKFDFEDQYSKGINSAQKFKDGVIDVLSKISNCIAWDCREGIGVLCWTTLGTDEWELSKETAARIQSNLLEYDSNLIVYIGISNMHAGIEGLKKSCQQALSAALAARCQAENGIEIIHYRQAGIFQFMPALMGAGGAKEYIDQHIGKLIAYDQAKKTNYLATLDEILRGASVRETADKQHLHPKSIVFRQKSIAKMLNVDLSDYQIRLALAIAIQLHKLNTI